MPAHESANLVQVALMWHVSDWDPETPRTDEYGELLVSDPVEVPVRWITRRTESSSFVNGATVAYDSEAIVDREITVGSLLWLGSFADWYGTGSAGDADDLRGQIMQVTKYSEIPDVKGRVALRKVGMNRYRNKLPSSIA